MKKFDFKRSLLFFGFAAAALLGSLPAKAQRTVSLNWKWNHPVYNSNDQIQPGDILKISFDQRLTAIKRKTFLTKSKFVVMDNTGHAAPPVNLVVHPEILQNKIFFNLTDYLGELKDGYKIILSPDFGTPDVFPSDTISIKAVTVTLPAVANVVNDAVKEHVERKIQHLKADEDTKIQTANQRIDQLKTEVKSIGALPVTDKDKEELQKRVAAFEKDRIDEPVYADCPSCKDLDGDLIYDFKCKLLVQARMMVDKENKPQINYYVVRNLKDIKVKDQQLLRLKVAGVNRYLYDVQITVDGVTFKSETPALWSSFFGGSGNLATALSGKSTAANGLQALKDEPEDPLITAMKKFEKDYNQLLEYQLKAYLLCPTAECCGSALPTEELSYFTSQLTEINYMLLQLETTTLKGIPGATELNDQIKTKQTNYDQTINYCDLKAKVDDLNKQIKDTDGKERVKLDSLTKLLATATADLAKMPVAASCEPDAKKKLKDELDKLKESLPLRTAMDKVKGSLPSFEDLRKLYLFDKNIARENFFYRLPPLYPQNDRLSVSLDINARDADIAIQMGFTPTYHDSFSLGFSVRNRTIFSFSSGPYVNFFASNSVRSYSWQAVPVSGNVVDANARYQLVESGKAAMPYGLGAFANIGKKFTDNLGGAITFGVGASLESSPLPTFMFGLSPTFGDDQRINLTFGIAASQLRTLKSDLYANSLYSTPPTPEYDKPFRIGGFISLSYAIFTTTSASKITSKSQP